MKVREVLKILYKDGWYDVRQNGSHIQLEHDVKPGTVTVPKHNGDLKLGTLKSLFRQAGIKL